MKNFSGNKCIETKAHFNLLYNADISVLVNKREYAIYLRIINTSGLVSIKY